MTTSHNDRAEVAEVAVRYANGIDRRDWAAFRSCFTDGCVLDYGRLGTWRCADAVTRHMDETHRRYGVTLHRITNVECTLTDGVAQMRSYVDAVLYWPDGTPAVQARGFYDDDLVKVDGHWRIDVRRFTSVEHLGAAPSVG